MSAGEKANAAAVARAGTMRIRGVEVETVTRDVEQSRLNFYVDNPRIYSLVRTGDTEPDQVDILDKLLELEHVKVLKEDIVANDGLIDPLIVRDGDMVVLEGNSRLAAYRFLAGKNPIKWGKVRCTVLPADIDDRLVFALLGQYHVKGKKDWAPFEKAGFLYRRYKDQGTELSVVATELGVRKGEAEHLVAVYEFMLEHGEADRDRWSFYDEYLKSRKIKKARTEYAAMDAFVIEQVRSQAIPKAMELRDKLPVICASPKNLKRYVEGRTDFEEAYQAAVVLGGENHALNKLRRFRTWLAQNDTEDDLLEPAKLIRDKMLFELKELEKRTHRLRELLEKAKAG